MTRPSRWWCLMVGAVGLLAADGSLASPRVLLEVQGELPFPRQDLVDLLKLRLPLAMGRSQEVRALVRGERDQLVIRVGNRTRTARTPAGLAGARLAMLLLLDLVAEEELAGASPLPPLPAPPLRASATPPRAPSPALSGWAPRFALGLGSAWTPLVRDQELAGVETQLDLGFRLYRRLGAFFQLGYSWTPTRYDDLTLRQLPMRLGLGVHTRYVEARGGLVVRPFWVRTPFRGYYQIPGRYDINAEGAQLGGTVQLKLNLPLARGLQLYAILGADFMGGRNEWTDLAWFKLQTNWVVPTTGLGLAYRWGTEQR